MESLAHIVSFIDEKAKLRKEAVLGWTVVWFFDANMLKIALMWQFGLFACSVLHFL